MSSKGSLDAKLSTRTSFFGLKLWVVIGICVCAFILLILSVLSIWVMVWRKSRKSLDKCYFSQMLNVSKELKFESVGVNFLCHNIDSEVAPNVHNKPFGSEKMEVHLGMSRSTDADNTSQCSSVHQHDKEFSSHSGEGSSGTLISIHKKSSSCGHALVSPLIGLPEFSHLGWGYWFTLRDLEFATNHFSKDNVLGEGGYGVVYKGRLINGAEVAIKKLLNNLIVDRGQAEKEFRVELEAIGHLRHKNLVRLLGYCVEGIHRMLVYEYVNNGNLEQWLHGAMHQRGVLSWEARMKTLFGTAKALAYLHEAIEPKVVHRDIKSSNILIDKEFNAKISDFGLAKLLGSETSHVTTRVMGTFGYVAPEYASTGLLNEKSDIYSFGVLMLEAITGRDPVDYGRPANEVNLVEWLKVMVANGRAEEVVDPNLDVKPTTRALKRVLLTALRCVNPDSEKRQKMSQVVQMLEADEFPVREDLRSRSRYTGSREIESLRCSSINMHIKVEKSEC